MVVLDIVSKIGKSRGRRLSRSLLQTTGSMLLEPLQGRQAECIVGEIAEHEPVPGERFIGSAHLLAKVGHSPVEHGMRFQTKRFDRADLKISPARLLGMLLDQRLEQLNLRMSLGRFDVESGHFKQDPNSVTRIRLNFMHTHTHAVRFLLAPLLV